MKDTSFLNFDFEGENLIYKKPNFFLKFLGNAFITLCVIIALFIILFSFMYVSAPVTGISMQPNLFEKDTVYINKIMPYSYEDIIVVELPSNPLTPKYIIKRVVGVPGDKIKIMQDSDNKVYLFRNNKKIEESYIFDAENSNDYNNLGMRATLQQYITLLNEIINYPQNYPGVVVKDGEIILQKDQYFALGDNRGYSEDSSVLGPFNKKQIVGKVDFILPNGTIPFYYFLKFYTGIDLGVN